MTIKLLLNIRPATAADLPAILGLERQCLTAAHWTKDQYHLALQTGGVERLFLVAEDAADGFQGFLVARHVDREWELENIVVSLASRRAGIGKGLLNALLSAARNTNSDSLFLEVRESNTAARGLYERSGFETSGRRKSYYQNPLEDAVIYRRGV